MSSLVIYRETIQWTLILLLVLVVDIPLFIVLFYELYLPPSPDPVTVAVLFMVLVVMAAVILTFSRLTVTMTTREITVRFGPSKRRFGWGEVEDCYPDEASAARYGGYGIRGGIYNGRRRLVYNVTNAERVVLKVRGKDYDEFVFSTRKPEQCMRIIRMQIGKPPLSLTLGDKSL